MNSYSNNLMKTALELFGLSVILFALTFSIVNASPVPQPLVKNSSCPSGYFTSGVYCVPSNNAKFAIVKNGFCPSGYYSSSSYCVASSNNSRLAIPRINSCPSGYYSSGNYCITSK